MEHRTFHALDQILDALCRHGGEFVRADDFNMRQLGFLSLRDDSRFMLPVGHAQENGPLVRLFNLRTQPERDAFAVEVSKDPEAVLKKLAEWQAAQKVPVST